MTTRKIANLLSRRRNVLRDGKDTFIVMPMADFDRLREAYEDTLDLLDLERARRESAGETPIPWERVKARLARTRPATRRSRKR